MKVREVLSGKEMEEIYNNKVYLCCALASTREGIEEADASGGHQQQGKDDIVHRGEVHSDYLPHDDTGRGGTGE